jgi:hypothetical protein
MGFFDDVPASLETRPEGDAWTRPAEEFPAVAVSAVLLARTEAVAVAVTAVWAFSAGFEFWIKAKFRESGRALEHDAEGQSLHVGVQFADGRKAADVGSTPSSAGSLAREPVMSLVSFGGGLLQRSRSYWVHPLPPPGPVTFACEWAAFGIPEQRADVDAGLILAAATRSVRLWPPADN